ncbi:MAG: VWA domain-containing protein [Labilithrix sp.]|nr:VWA domain-containing protein [Labilithrix sp.]MCW5833967.1 VWA domain-containing protein [Labilithrix sp.]
MSRIGTLKMMVSASSMMVGAIVFAGCGSSGDSTFGDGSGDGDGSGGALTGFGDGDGTGGDGKGNGNGNGSGTAGNVGNVDPTSACATASDGAELQPISLVFMIDRSGSMSNDGGSSTVNVRWNPVKEGLGAFFGDPASSNISASLAFFPIRNGNNTTCSSAAYQSSVVPMTQLPNAAAFSSAFSQNPAGNTPTVPALQGALDAARAVKATGKNVAVVLATDGQPNGCSSNTSGVEAVAAAGAADGIKTYVIGVGPSTGNLNGFADKGGTGSAIMIPTNDAAQVSADLQKAIGQIASSLLGCNYGLPAPPAGQTLDVNAVNVNYTPPGGASKTLAYSADCKNKDGWRYDNVTAPKEIILCADSCATAKAQAGAKLDIIFGCATAVPPGEIDPDGNIR